MTSPQKDPYIEEIKKEWDIAFTPQIPSMLEGVEIENPDGTRSCISCGIKREAVADWWIEKLSSYALAQVEKERGLIARHLNELLDLCTRDDEAVIEVKKYADILQAIKGDNQ